MISKYVQYLHSVPTCVANEYNIVFIYELAFPCNKASIISFHTLFVMVPYSLLLLQLPADPIIPFLHCVTLIVKA